ncbi:MAG: rhamnulose-1-phosphate aldolase [Erysipelotrichaceae bacterium]|nr:rhamnulose-1-phosphate aldolase [Erysipelotrichaceae bacterium]
MDIINIEWVSELVEACNYFWEAGWGECHAGNISYLLDEKELAEVKDFLKVHATVPVDFDTEGLEGRCFMLTRSGSAFRTMKKRYMHDMGIIRFVKGAYEILWGFDDGEGRPTSELPAHVLCHRARLQDDPRNKIVMHCHPTYLNAMTMIHELDEEEFTKTLWKMNSECVLVFPEGLAMLPWMVCGEGPIGPATAEKMKNKRVVIWPFHGIFSSGNSLFDAIGLIETIDKNAHVYVLTKANMIHSMTDENVEELRKHFHL